MRAYVFTDTALTEEAGRFVWLEMNTEKKESAAFSKKYAVAALPTYFIVSPDSESVLLRRVGGATTGQLKNILDAGERAMSGGKLLPADALALEADRFYGSADYKSSAPLYQRALSEAPAGWPARDRTVESLLFAFSMADSNEAAARLSLREIDGVRGRAASANVAASGLDAAASLPEENSGRSELLEKLEAEARGIVANVPPDAPADDISGVYIALITAREAVKDSAGAHDTAVEWSTFLDGAAAKAPNAEARGVFDSHRLSAYIEIGHPERAIPMLEASERDLPDDYNPPARLAAAYRVMKKYDDALAASTRAVAKAYGPRKLGILQTRSDIQAALGDTAAARATLTEAVAMAEAFPEGQRSPAAIERLKKKIAALGVQPQ